MKHFLLIFTVLMVGCGGGDGGPNESMNHEAQPPGDSKPVSVSPPTHTKDSLALIKERVAKNEAVLIDVREKDEWDDGHIQSAIFLPLSGLKKGGSSGSFAGKLAIKLPKDKVVYCHCVSGGRVLPASAILQKLGYDVRPLKPGYKALLKAGFEKAK